MRKSLLLDECFIIYNSLNSQTLFSFTNKFQKVPNNRMQEWNAHRDGAGENIFILTSFQKEEERERDKEHMINEREENSVGSHSLLNPAQVVVDLGIDTKLASRCTACTPGDNALDLSIADDRGPESLWSERKDHYHMLMRMWENGLQDGSSLSWGWHSWYWHPGKQWRLPAYLIIVFIFLLIISL